MCLKVKKPSAFAINLYLHFVMLLLWSEKSPTFEKESVKNRVLLTMVKPEMSSDGGKKGKYPLKIGSQICTSVTR